MTETKRPAARKKPGAEAAAALAETNGNGQKSCEWRGLVLTLPAELPATVGFDIALLETSEDGLAMFRLVRDIVGSDQFALVRNKVAEAGASSDELEGVFEELLEAVFAPYGVGLGES